MKLFAQTQSWRAALSLLLLGLVCASAVRAQQAPTRIFVNERPVSLATSVPALRDGQLFLPLSPIARELRDEITVDSSMRVIQVRLSHTGETRIFDRNSGEVLRDGQALGVFPDTSAIVVALVPETQQLPVEVLSLLLDVNVQVKATDGEVHLRRNSQITLTSQVSGRLPVLLERVDYTETLGVIEGMYGHTLRLSSRGRAFDSVVTSGVEYTGGSHQQFLNLLGAFVTVERPSGQLWTGGDFTAAASSRFAATPARGLSLVQPIGSYRLNVFGGASLSQATVGAGSFSLRNYNTGIVGFLFANRQMVRGGGSGFGMEWGGLHFADAGRSATMFVQQLSRRGRIHQFSVESGFGYFRAGSGASADIGPSFGVDAVDSIALRRHTVVLRAAHFGDRFLTPQIGDSTRGRTVFSGAWAAPVHSHLTVGASVAHQRVRIPYAQAGSTFTWSAAYNHQRAFLPDVSAAQTIATSSASSQFSNLQINLSRSFRRVRPSFSYNRLGSGGFSNHAVSSSTIGATVELGKLGQLQGYQNFSPQSQRSGSVDWSPRPLWRNRIQVSGGVGYEHLPFAGAGSTATTSLSTRVNAYVKLPFHNTLQFSFQQSAQRREFRFTLGGSLFARETQLAAPGAGPRSMNTLPSGIAGRLYQDRNFNGRYDHGVDAPLPGTRVWLDSTILADTDDSGMYRFPAVFAGPHSVNIDVTTLRADFTSLNPMDRKIEVPARVEVTVDFSFVQTGAASGMAWFDSNRNNIMDSDETPASGLRILCSCGKDAPTTADGVFILGDLLPGEIYITVDQQTLPQLFVMNPQRLKVFVEPGRRVDGLRIAIQPRERFVEEKVLPSQMLGAPAAPTAPAATAPNKEKLQ